MRYDGDMYYRECVDGDGAYMCIPIPVAPFFCLKLMGLTLVGKGPKSAY